MTSAPQRTQFHALTGLRGIAAIWVALFHASEPLGLATRLPIPLLRMLGTGWLAVDFFFILSGFVISHVHLDDFRAITRKSWSDFLILRIARIYPAHLLAALAWVPVVLLVTQFMPQLATEGFIQNYSWSRLLHALTLSNGMGLPNSDGWNLPSWSVGSEWIAYLCFPVIAHMLMKVRTTTGGLVLGLAMFAASMLLALGIRGTGQFALPWSWAAFRVVSEFFIGCCILVAHRHWKERRDLTALVNSTLALLLLLSVLPGRGILDGLFILLFAVLILALTQSSGLASRLLSAKPLRFLGNISYSMYLMHALVLLVFARVSKQLGVQGIITIPAYLAAIILAGYLSYRFVEEPGRRMIRRAIRTT